MEQGWTKLRLGQDSDKGRKTLDEAKSRTKLGKSPTQVGQQLDKSWTKLRVGVGQESDKGWTKIG